MTGQGRYYTVHGLTVESAVALPGAQPWAGDGQPDLRIVEQAIAAPEHSDDGFRTFVAGPDCDLLAYQGVARFLIQADCIGVDWDPDFDRRLAGLPLLGPIIALVLHRRGQLVLHGSAVAIGGQAHVFLGDKGAGKSTTAAAFLAAGFPLVSDDVVGLRLTQGGQIVIDPGPPVMKLARGMLPAFAAGTYAVLEPDQGAFTAGKCRVRFLQQELPPAVPVGRIFCLARGEANASQPLDRNAALHALIRFAHFPRLGAAAMQGNQTAQVFARALQFLPGLAVERLTVRDSLAELGQLIAFVQREVADA